jgi:hypothetical protein
MPIKELDTVALVADLPKHGLKAGDLGAVVHVNSPASLEVEFVTAAGSTQALVTLAADQIRLLGSRDILAVRRLDAA